MEESFDSDELQNFYKNLIEDLKSIQISEEEGGFLEQIFTQNAVELLEESGETENVIIAYDEKSLGKRNQHKINAYSLSDNNETIDLFITVFKGTESISKLSKDDIDTAVKRITNFYKKGRYSDYKNDIEESSPIFDFVHTLGSSESLNSNLVRVNVIILTDGIYSGAVPERQFTQNIPIFYRIVDLNYIYNITQKSHIPIEINFSDEGFEIPCIMSPSRNKEYQSYLAIISGEALASIYEKYGSRLLEQNVRSFLQFTGKINKGIRNTILKEKHMFLAYNNGLSATADNIIFEKSTDKNGLIIKSVENFQIVNGGQTTASIYHTMKKDKADISEIFVQLKITVVYNKEKFSEIVSRISEYANTQNKVSVVDLSSNQPFHIDLEKLSRNIWAQPVQGQSQQTRWFYERARGQYKNAILNFGFTKGKRKAFELRNPKNQVFKKEDLAKFVNSWEEVFDGKKLVIGPFMVVKGNQKNYVQFMNYNFVKHPDNIYFEDCISKAILFKNAEKIYGVKPNSIGDMRYITVPYSIAWLGYKLNYKLDLYKIWKYQDISAVLKDVIFKIMIQIEGYIKKNAPGSLYAEWAKKEECWNDIKKEDFNIDLSIIKDDMSNINSVKERKSITKKELEKREYDEKYERVKSVYYQIWKEIKVWGEDKKTLSDYLRNIAFEVYNNLRVNKNLTEIHVREANKILDLVIDKNPELIFNSDEIVEQKSNESSLPIEISLDLIKEIVEWDFKEKKLKDYEYIFMRDLATGRKKMNDRNIYIAGLNYKKILKYGFKRKLIAKRT